MGNSRKKYDQFPEVPFETRPKVLFVGNGINRPFTGSVKTDEIVKGEWKKSYGNELTAWNAESPSPIWNLPFPMQMVAATKDHVQGSMTNLAMLLKGMTVCSEQQSMITQIIDANFDAILSTNYSMEIEKSTIPQYSDNKAMRLYKISREQSSIEKRFGIYQCTEIPYGNSPLLWHIHGTALRKTSLVIGHQFYGSLLSEVTNRAKTVTRETKKAQTIEKPFRPQSWIDYFLIGDVYMMGFALDYSEIDIWWLISYKSSLFPESKMYFFDPSLTEGKRLLLDCYGVVFPSITITKDDYIDYYIRICDGVRTKKW